MKKTVLTVMLVLTIVSGLFASGSTEVTRAWFEADKLAEQLPAESKLVVSAKKKADYALLNAANVKKTVQNFYDEYYRHGLDLKTLQIVSKQKVTAQENKEGEK